MMRYQRQPISEIFSACPIDLLMIDGAISVKS